MKENTYFEIQDEKELEICYTLLKSKWNISLSLDSEKEMFQERAKFLVFYHNSLHLCGSNLGLKKSPPPKVILKYRRFKKQVPDLTLLWLKNERTNLYTITLREQGGPIICSENFEDGLNRFFDAMDFCLIIKHFQDYIRFFKG
jgi:hypothetical protein